MQIISKPTRDEIKSAARALKNGHLVSFPTETVYGLGADAENLEAIDRLYEVKGRPKDHPVIVHIADVSKLNYWASKIPEYANDLAKRFWPGPMTLLLPRSSNAVDAITGGQDVVGIRIPSHPIAQELLSRFQELGGNGVVAPSANRFGIDVNDKDAFARVHFQVKGQGQGYDAAKDILTAGGVQDEIYNNILPALKEEALKQGSVFGQFITPEEFADEMLRGLDPADKSTWEEVLQRYGLTDFKGTVDELKEYTVGTLRTGSAQEIREQIKYLNEKRQRPTQAVLGLTYIERPEDYKDEMATPQTELYKVFQSAGLS